MKRLRKFLVAYRYFRREQYEWPMWNAWRFSGTPGEVHKMTRQLVRDFDEGLWSRRNRAA